MADYSTNLKSWGDIGEEFPNGYHYIKGEQPVDAWDNFINRNLIKDAQHLVSLTNKRLESESGTGYPGSPEPGHIVWRSDKRTLVVYDETNSSWRELAYKADLDNIDLSDYDNHIEDTSNPHSVTTSQIGAAEKNHDHSGETISPDTVDANTVEADTAIIDGEALSAPTISKTKPSVGPAGSQWFRLEEPGEEIWSHTHHGPGALDCHVEDGVVYTSSDPKIVAADLHTGDKIWEHSHHGSNRCDSIHVHRDLVISGGRDDDVVAANKTDGSLEWRVPMGNSVNAIHAEAMTVFAGSNNSLIKALDYEDGSLKWDYSTNSWVREIFTWNGRVYAAINDDDVICLDADDGSFIWSHSLHDENANSVFVKDGVCYSTSRNGNSREGMNLIAADAYDGDFLWRLNNHEIDMDNGDITSLTVSHERDGILYVDSTSEPYIVGINTKTGAVVRKIDTPAGVWHSFFDEGIVVAATSGAVYGLVDKPSVYVSDGNNWHFSNTLGPEQPFKP